MTLATSSPLTPYAANSNFPQSPTLSFSPGTDDPAEMNGTMRTNSQSNEDSGTLQRSQSSDKFLASLSQNLSGSVLAFDDLGSGQNLTQVEFLSEASSPGLKARDIEHILRQNLASLIGAEDYSGCRVIVIPNRITKLEFTSNQNSFLETLRYFTVVSKPENKTKGFTVIVDTRGTFGKSVKTFARFFAALPDSFVTKQLIFIKSGDFIEKQIANLRIKTKRNREVPVHFVSLKKLERFVDKQQLPSELGGSVSYNHRMWINNRLDFESFVSNADNLLAATPNRNTSNLIPDEVTKEAVKDCISKGEELLKRLVNLPDPNSLQNYQPESCDQRDMRTVVESYLSKLSSFKDPLGTDEDDPQNKKISSAFGDKDLGPKMSEKRELLEQLIQDAIKFIDWTRNEGSRLMAGIVDEIGREQEDTKSLLAQNDSLFRACQKHFDWYENLMKLCEQLKFESYRVEKVEKILGDVENAYKPTLGKLQNRKQLLELRMRFHEIASQVESISGALEKSLNEDVYDGLTRQQCEDVLAQSDDVNQQVESSFMQLESTGDSMLGLLGSLKEQSPETAASRNLIKDSLMSASDSRDKLLTAYENWRSRITQFMDLLDSEKAVQDITSQIVENFGFLAQTLQDDIRNGTSNFRASFSVREPPTRELYAEGVELINRISLIRTNLNLSQDPVEDLREELAATWKNFFIQLAENGSEEHVLEICWMLMVQNWKVVEKLFKELKQVAGEDDPEKIRSVLNRSLDFKNYVDVSYEQTEIITSTFIERMSSNQKNGSVLSNEEILKLRQQLESMTKMKVFIDQSYSGFVSQREVYTFFQVMIETCDWVRIKITEMVPGMLEIGSNLIEALNLYQIHIEFMEKIENRHEEIREVLRKADTMVESTDESQSQVYQAMAISLKDAWKELMMRMEERRILLELVIGFYRGSEEFNQHMDYAYSVCQSTLIADNIEQVQVMIEEHQEMKKATAEHSMNTVQSGQGLIDKIVEIGRNLENHGPKAVSASSSVERMLAELHDRRTLLEELWLQRKIRLEQSLLIFQLDAEIQQITNWFLTIGSDNMHHVDLGNNPSETQKLIEIHMEFSNEAKIIETRITRVLRSVDTLILTGHEDGDNIRERVAEIETLNKDILVRIENRRKRLTLTLDFWNSASIAFDRLVEIEEQIEETLNMPDTPSLGKNWRYERLNKLAQAILESTTPAIREGHIILDDSSVGADGVRFIVEKLKERCAHLGSICNDMRNERSSLYVMYDEKYSVITTWLVNIGLDLLNRRRTLGTTLQSASDFLDDHCRLRDDLKTRFIDVEACGSIVESMEISQESGAIEARSKVEELKQRWRTLVTFTEQRIPLAEIFLVFLNKSTEMVNLMDTLEELLKLENWNFDSRTLESTRRIWMEKFRIMNEIYETVYYKGRCFLKDSKTQTMNDKHLSVEVTMEYVQKQLELFEERRRIINDLWDTWKMKMPFIRDMTSQWDMFSNDAKKSLGWIVDVQKRLFAPLVIGDPKHCRQTAYVMRDRLDEIKTTYQRVTSEVERWLKMGEMLNIKQQPEHSKDNPDPDSQGMEEILKIPQKLIGEHKNYQSNMQVYEIHLTALIDFLLKLGDLYDAIDATYSEVEKAKSSEDPEFVIKVIQVLDSTKEKEVQLFEDTVKSGKYFMAQVDEQHNQPAKKETKAILADLELDHKHWITWYEQCTTELQKKIQSATQANRAIYILQCIDQFRNELFDMEGVYGDSSDGLAEIVKNFELWLQDLDNFEDKDLEPFFKNASKSGSSVDSKNFDRCKQKWSDLQKAIEKHRKMLKLAKEYHMLLDDLETLSVETRESVIEISRRTPDAKSLEKVNVLRKDLDGCSNKVDKLYVTKLDRIYELAKILFDPPPIYLESLRNRRTELRETIETIHRELIVKYERYTFDDQIEKVVLSTDLDQLNSMPTSLLPPVPPKTPPRIITGLQDKTVTKGQPAVFDCTLIGSAPLKVTWQKDGRRLIDSATNKISSNANKYTLKFPNTTLDDIGTVTIVVENDFGKTNSSAYLHVQGPQGVAPSIYKIAETLPRLDVGSKIRLDAAVAGTPTPEVVWYKNGRELTPSDRVKIRASDDGTHQLLITDCEPGDSGDYSISASNEVGEATKTCKVTVGSKAKPPKFLSPLKDAEAEDGKPFRWEVEVEGNPTPVVKWYKGKEDMANFECEIQQAGGVSVLILDEIFPDDEGNYRVVATNDQGSDETSAVLSVKVVGEPPKFVKKPVDKECPEGKSAEFTCKVTGVPMPEVKWMNKDGEEIKHGEDFTITNKNGNCTLLIKDVIPEDDGRVVCKAVNKIGETSCSFVVKVLCKTKPFFEVPIKDASCKELDAMTFDCVVSGDPKPKVHWLHNGEKIEPDNTNIKVISTGNKHSLQIKEILYSDRGTYKAVASNSLGEEGCSAFLSVEELPPHLKPHPPRIEAQMPSQLYATEGEALTLECEVAANPVAEVTWFKDRKNRLRAGPDLKIANKGKTYTLTFRSCYIEDSGSYTMVAKNKHGEVSASCNVYVKEKELEPEAPEFVIGLGEMVALEGDSVTFECVVKGTPTPTVFWYLNGEKLEEAADQQIRRNEDKHLLKLHKLEVDDTGPLTVTASNVAGNVSSTAPLVVNPREKKPILIQPLSSVKTRIGDQEAIMECKIANANSGCSINLYKDDQPVPSNERVQLLNDGQDILRVQIRDVIAEDEGQYCIEVANGAGAVSTSAFCHIQANKNSKYGSSTIIKSEEVVTKTSSMHLESSGDPPAFISDLLQPPVVQIGQDVTLEIIVKGTPSPDVHWLKDDRPVDPKRCTVLREENKCSLMLRQVTALDEGEYCIVAENSSGVAKCTCQLLIDDTSNAPIFTERLVTKEVEEGQSIELAVSVRGHPEPSVQWLLNGEPFKPKVGDGIYQEGPRHKCFIKNVTQDHNGKVSVVAENSKGKAKSSAEIIVTDSSTLPTFIKQLEDVKLPENDNLKLDVELSFKCDVVWLKDNQPLKSDSSSRLETVEKGTKYFLSLKNTRSTDSGIYSLRASAKNSKKSVSTSNCNVIVQAIREAPLIRRKLTNRTVPAGEQVVFEVEVTGHPEPKVTWFRDEAEITSSKDFHLDTRGQRHYLTIPEVFAEDQGTFKVVAENVAGKDSSSAVLNIEEDEEVPITLDVVSNSLNSQPIIMNIQIAKPLEPLTVQEGNPVALQCELAGPPNDSLIVSWSKDGECVDSDPNYSFSFKNNVARCFISECFPEDNGTWTVSFRHPDWNSDDVTTSSATLTCKEVQIVELITRSHENEAPEPFAPEFLKKLTPQRLVEGGHALFQCVVSGFPPPDVQWLKNGEIVQSGYRYQVHNDPRSGNCSLSISFILPEEDAGVYTCIASNVKGQASTEAQLLDDDAFKKFMIEVQKQQFVGELTTKVRESSLTRKEYKKFVVTVFEDRLLNEIEFRADKLRSSLQHYSHDDDPDDEGVPDDETEPPTFASQPKSHKLVEGSTVRFECQLYGNPAPRFNWFHNGRPLYPSHRVNMSRTLRDPVSGTTKAVLTLSKVLFDDQGYYTVLAWNALGRATCSSQLYTDRMGPFEEKPEFFKSPAYKMLEARNRKIDGPPVQSGVAEKHLAPCFISKPVDLFVKQNIIARFDCKVAGRPTPTLTWYHDGQEISVNDPNRQSVVREDGTNSLLFHSVKLKDAGQYECVATNKGGEARFIVRLAVDEKSVEEPPKIVEKPPSNIPVSEGEPVFLRVSATGNPEPELTFTKDGVKKNPYYYGPVHDRPLVEKIGPGVFEVSFADGVRKDDNGWYTCAAKNPSGVDSFSCKISVKQTEPDDLKPNPVKISIPKRGTHPLPPPTPPIQMPSYVKKDEWDENELFTSSKPHEPPKFKKLLNDISIAEGNRTFMECTVYPAGDPSMVVEWFKDGHPILHGSRIHPIFEFGFCVLEFDDVWSRDDGLYTCRAVNKVGQAEVSCRMFVSGSKSMGDDSQNPIGRRADFEFPANRGLGSFNRNGPSGQPNLSEKNMPPCFITKPVDLFVKQNIMARFECKVSGQPRPTLTWYHNGREISVDDPNRQSVVREDGTNSLLFHCVKLDDSGQYECVASNKSGEAKFNVGLAVDEKSVEEPPKIVEKPPSNIPVSEGEPVFLRVSATGNPEPELTFSKDGVKKDPYNFGPARDRPLVEKIGPGVYEISFPDGVDKDDNGWYTCAAKNPAGVDSFNCKINVQKTKPDNVKPNPVKISIPKRGTHPLPAAPAPMSMPSYVKKDEWDENELFASSKPHEPPRFKKLLSDISIVEGNKTFMECTVYPAGDPTMVVEWFKDGRPILHGTRIHPIFEFGFCVLEFDDVWPRDSGLYTCRAVNKVGQAEVSCRVSVKGTKSLVEESQLPLDMRAGFEQLNEWEQIRANMPPRQYNDDEEVSPPLIVQYPEKLEVIEGMPAKFLCRVNGNPVPSVFWYKNDQILSSSNRIHLQYDGIHTLEISKTRASDTGTVSLIARNPYGEARFDTLLVVSKKSGGQTSRVTHHKTESVVMKKFVSNTVTTNFDTNSSASPNGHIVQSGIRL